MSTDLKQRQSTSLDTPTAWWGRIGGPLGASDVRIICLVTYSSAAIEGSIILAQLTFARSRGAGLGTSVARGCHW